MHDLVLRLYLAGYALEPSSWTSPRSRYFVDTFFYAALGPQLRQTQYHRLSICKASLLCAAFDANPTPAELSVFSHRICTEILALGASSHDFLADVHPLTLSHKTCTGTFCPWNELCVYVNIFFLLS